MTPLDNVIIQAIVSAIAGIISAGFGALAARATDRRAWTENEVYQPLYNEIHDATQGDLPKGWISAWDEFGEYKKTRVENQFRNYMNEYTRLLQKLSEIGGDSDRWYDWFADSLPSEKGSIEIMIDPDREERTLYAQSWTLGRPVREDMDIWLDRHLPEFDRLDGYTEGEKIERRFKQLSNERDWDYTKLYDSWREVDSNVDWGQNFAMAYQETTMGKTETNIWDVAHVRREIQDKAREIEAYMNEQI